MEQTVYTLKLENFEGPFDLLFHLIEKNKMDIYNIQIAEITDQYIEYLKQMEKLDLEITSEFLVMASTLLHLKSKMLLPKPAKPEEEQLDLKENLVKQLLEYKKYKQISLELGHRKIQFSKMFYKPHEIIKLKNKKIENPSYDPDLIPNLYQLVCQRNYDKINHNLESKIQEILSRDKITVRSKLKDIVRRFLQKSKVKLSELFQNGNDSRMDKVTSFMAVLELARVNRIEIEQKELFGEIEIRKLRKKGA